MGKLAKFAFAVAFTLQWAIGIIWVLHQHIFCLLGRLIRDHCFCNWGPSNKNYYFFIFFARKDIQICSKELGTA